MKLKTLQPLWIVLIFVLAACAGAPTPTSTPAPPPTSTPSESENEAETVIALETETESETAPATGLSTFVIVPEESRASYVVSEEFFEDALAKLGIEAGNVEVVRLRGEASVDHPPSRN